MSKETAFYPRLKALTDEWMDLFGYFAPLEVTDTEEEYRAVRETAGLMDFTMLRKVDLDGDGALDLVNSIVTRDVSKLTPGHIAYGALTDEDGMMVDDCTTMMRAPDHVRFCGANDRDYEIFSAAAEGSDIVVREFTDDMPHLCLQGPKSREMLQGMTDADLSAEAAARFYDLANARPAWRPLNDALNPFLFVCLHDVDELRHAIEHRMRLARGVGRDRAIVVTRLRRTQRRMQRRAVLGSIDDLAADQRVRQAASASPSGSAVTASPPPVAPMSAISTSGAKTSSQPGNMPPANMRTISDTACAAANSGSTCSACDGTENHSSRRWIVMAKKLSKV